MSHSMDFPITHRYRGKEVFVKFEWRKPNDLTPAAAHVVTEGEIEGLGEIAVDLSGPWDNYQQAVAEAVKAAEVWIDQQLPQSK